MRWSKLKQRIESGFAPEIAERVEVHTTRYRRAHDGAGRSWITVDGAEIINMDMLSGELFPFETRAACGRYAAYDLPNSMRAFLNMNIGDALQSQNPLIRALAVIDRRIGKRRIQLLDPSTETSPVAEFIRLRQSVAMEDT
jgi:hypothetical protein